MIGVAWLAARPVVGGAMLAVAFGLFALSAFCHKKHKQSRPVGIQQPMTMEAGLMQPMQQPMVQGFAQPGFAQPAPGMAQPGFAQPMVAAVAAAPAQAGSRVTVTCPAGVGPGMQVQVDTPQGPRLVVVPQGVQPGQPFDVFL